MSTDNTIPTPDDVTVLPRVIVNAEEEEGFSASQVFGTAVAVSEIIKTSVIETIVNTSDAVDQKAIRAQLTDVLDKAKVGGLAGIGLFVYDSHNSNGQFDLYNTGEGKIQFKGIDLSGVKNQLSVLVA